MAKAAEYTSLLLCEGADEVGLFEGLQSHLELPTFHLLDLGGNTKLRKALSAVTVWPNFHLVTRIAIVRDAHADPAATMQSISDALREFGLPSPDAPLQEKLSSGDSPRRKTMALVLPGGESTGQLESLCARAFADNPVLRDAMALLEKLKDDHDLEFNQLPKRKIQVALAAMPAFKKSIGYSAKTRHWPWAHEAFDGVKTLARWVAQGSERLPR